MLVTDNDYPQVYGDSREILYVVLQPYGWPFHVQQLGANSLRPLWWSRSFLTEGALRADVPRLPMTPELRKNISELTWSEIDASHR